MILTGGTTEDDSMIQNAAVHELPSVGRIASILVVVVVALWVTACDLREDHGSAIEESLGLTTIAPQELQTRIWPDIRLRELFTVPTGDEIYFVLPRAVRADESGNFIVMDFGDWKVKGFDGEGNYINSYGAGIGEAPGELTQGGVSDIGVLRDSLVYVTDRVTQRVSVFGLDGRFLETYGRSRHLARYRSGGPFRHSITTQGRTYTMFNAGRSLFGVSSNGAAAVVSFGPPINASGSQFHQVMGMMTTYNEQLVYAPLNYPVIIQYNPDGTVAYARATLDYGRTELPYIMSSETINGIPVERPGGGIVNGTVSTSDDKIYVQAMLESAPSFDVYDAGSGRYEYSFRSESGYDVFAIGDRVYAARDSTVVVWAIEWVGQ